MRTRMTACMRAVFPARRLMARAKRAKTRRMVSKSNPLWSVISVGVLLAAACVEQSQEPQPTDEDIQAARVHVLKDAPTPRYPSQAVLQNSAGGKVTYLGLDT